ncbi:MAG TPA: aldolase/citrate lyase family protein [Prosthecobacter sp.]|nr:aldolase/citrate lyase family protein [Prosthecobacter sp.]
MKLRTSRVLREVRAGQRATVIKLNLIDPRIVELAGLAGASAVWLCNEHVPNSWLNLEHQVRAAKLHDMDTIVRVSKGSYSEYVKPFELDATGIMVPHVTSADEARNIVDMVRCHPLGRRAMDGGNMDGNFCQIPLAEYAAQNNNERFVILQIESPEALEVVEEIAAVPGFDMLLFGAGDFSHRIGKLGQATHPEVVAARKRVAAAALKNGKYVAVASLYGQKEEVISEGTQVFTLGADVLSLGDGFNKLVSNFTEDAEKEKAASVYR